jgi:hypothetical protein
MISFDFNLLFNSSINFFSLSVFSKLKTINLNPASDRPSKYGKI